MIDVHGVEFQTCIDDFVGAGERKRAEVHAHQRHGPQIRVAGGDLASTHKETGRRTTIGVDIPGVKVGVVHHGGIAERRHDGAFLD